MHSDLATITQLSHRYGEPYFVKGGGGNTSCKNDDTLWVKPSGTTLSGLAPETFVPMDRHKLTMLYDWQPPKEVHQREAEVKDMMLAAVRQGASGRPSVESPLHDSFPQRFVVHTHMTLCNGLTCARDGETAAARLFPDALWVPYVDPGFVLAMDVRRRIKTYTDEHGRAPQLVLLDNHGLFVAGDTPEQIDAVYEYVQQILNRAFADAGVTMQVDPGNPDADTVNAARPILAEALGDEAQHIAAVGPFDAPQGPITPDHVVYARSYPHVGEISKTSIAAYIEEHGLTPRVFVTDDTVLAIGATPARAELCLSMAIDGAQIQQLAQAFGGIEFLSNEHRRFIEQWEVEAYRSSQL